MKINEIVSLPNTYLAVVRVVTRDSSTVSRTTITADSASSALVMLKHIYGSQNVVSLTQIVNESPRTCQIESQAPESPQSISAQQNKQEIDSVQLDEKYVTARRIKKNRISAKPIPAAIKHELIQRRLTNQMLRQSNLIKPTVDDIRIAKNRAETELKRADLEFEKDQQRSLYR